MKVSRSALPGIASLRLSWSGKMRVFETGRAFGVRFVSAPHPVPISGHSRPRRYSSSVFAPRFGGSLVAAPQRPYGCLPMGSGMTAYRPAPIHLFPSKRSHGPKKPDVRLFSTAQALNEHPQWSRPWTNRHETPPTRPAPPLNDRG